MLRGQGLAYIYIYIYIYKFYQELEVKPRIDIGFVKREKFNQEEI